MGDELQLTIVYEDGGDGWILARVLEVPAAVDQGRTRDEARTNVLDAVHAVFEMWPGQRPGERDVEMTVEQIRARRRASR